MTETLRHALDALAAGLPEDPRRRDAVWTRYRRARRRRTGAAATLLVAGAVVAGIAGTGTGGSHGLQVTDRGTPRATPSGVAPSPAAPAGSSSGRALGSEPAATPLPAAPRPSRPPSPVPSPTSVPSAERTATGVYALPVPAHARAGDEVSLTTLPFATDNGLDSVTVSWGDGVTETHAIGYCPPRDERTGRHHVGIHQQQAYEHRYAAYGRYEVRVTATFRGCGLPAATATAVAQVRIDDAAFDDLNGPDSLRLSARILEDADGRAGTSRLLIEALDTDAVVGFAVVEWDDGTMTLLRGALPEDCEAARGALDRAWPMEVEHTFTSDGFFNARVAAWSMSCDGRRVTSSQIEASANGSRIDDLA